MKKIDLDRDVLWPAFVGHASLGWIYVCVMSGAPEWVSILAMPGAYYAAWKLGRFLIVR